MTEANSTSGEHGDRIKDGAQAAVALRELFPALFAGAPKPVKLRIQTDIETRVPGRFSRQALTAFLRRHTATTAYLAAIVRSSHRFDLDGAPVAELSAEHKAAAQAALTARKEKLKARDAEIEAARRWRAELLRAWQATPLSRANFCALRGVADSALDALLDQAKTEAATAPSTSPKGPRPAKPQHHDRREKRAPRGRAD